MTRKVQLQREREFVEAMVVLRPLELRGEPVPMSPPLPDFELLLADGRRIGLEVTEARDPDVAAAWAGTKSRLEREIKRHLERSGVAAEIHLYLHVEALIDLQRDRQQLTDLGARIASVARASLPHGRPATNGARLGLDETQYVEVRPAERSFVMTTVSGMPRGARLIQQAIDLKVPKLNGYRTLGADEYWLLVVGGAALSGYVTVGDARGRPYESPFDRTVFLEPTDRACLDLETIPSRLPDDDDDARNEPT